jgi:quercetin dioxygenase-like cupin family protein
MLEGRPDDRCQCPHWGYVFAGKTAVSYADREKVIAPGDAFSMSPGQTPAAIAGTEFLQFSPIDELAVSEVAMAKNRPEIQGGR